MGETITGSWTGHPTQPVVELNVSTTVIVSPGTVSPTASAMIKYNPGGVVILSAGGTVHVYVEPAVLTTEYTLFVAPSQSKTGPEITEVTGRGLILMVIMFVYTRSVHEPSTAFLTYLVGLTRIPGS